MHFVYLCFVYLCCWIHRKKRKELVTLIPALPPSRWNINKLVTLCSLRDLKYLLSALVTTIYLDIYFSTTKKVILE